MTNLGETSHSNNRNNNTNDLVHIRLPNISSEIFQIILEYIYGGILPLNMNDTSDFLKVLVAADNLHLQDLVDYLQKYLVENKSEWIEQHFGFFSLTSREFSQKIRPYHKLLDQQLYEELLNSYLDPVKGNEEILGGYNPLKWESTNSYGKTEDSFIFSFKNRNIKDAILSNVIDATRALDYSTLCGPQFGPDLTVNSSSFFNINECANFNFSVIYCKRNYYEKRIRDNENDFSIEDYEVFKIIRR
ncbi:BTB/POZ protein [Rhizophagus irregularis DAOM 181602=DAOM 197198]|nr:BTB/POZ protein [Rhizophagus irregularis DAOM 181602=DAOM 197198]